MDLQASWTSERTGAPVRRQSTKSSISCLNGWWVTEPELGGVAGDDGEILLPGEEHVGEDPVVADRAL